MNKAVFLFVLVLMVSLAMQASAESAWGRILGGVAGGILTYQQNKISDSEICKFVDKEVAKLEKEDKIAPCPLLQEVMDEIVGKYNESHDSHIEPPRAFLCRESVSESASALPGSKGGYVFFSVKLFTEITEKNDVLAPDCLAGVLAHEFVHIVENHAKERIARDAKEKGVITAIGIGVGANSESLMALDFGRMLLSSLPYSRSQEKEADIEGTRLLAKTSFGSRALIHALKTVKEVYGDSNAEWLAGHPTLSHRIEYLEQETKKLEKEEATVEARAPSALASFYNLKKPEASSDFFIFYMHSVWNFIRSILFRVRLKPCKVGKSFICFSHSMCILFLFDG